MQTFRGEVDRRFALVESRRGELTEFDVRGALGRAGAGAKFFAKELGAALWAGLGSAWTVMEWGSAGFLAWAAGKSLLAFMVATLSPVAGGLGVAAAGVGGAFAVATVIERAIKRNSAARKAIEASGATSEQVAKIITDEARLLPAPKSEAEAEALMGELAENVASKIESGLGAMKGAKAGESAAVYRKVQDQLQGVYAALSAYSSHQGTRDSVDDAVDDVLDTLRTQPARFLPNQQNVLHRKLGGLSYDIGKTDEARAQRRPGYRPDVSHEQTNETMRKLKEIADRVAGREPVDDEEHEIRSRSSYGHYGI